MPPISVVVVSHGRPGALMRCLDGIAQIDYPAFEVVVVACARGHAAALGRRDAGSLTPVRQDAANISAARNLGIAQAAGELVAFIDDDAVPEPLWLRHLSGPFADPRVGAAGGYVLGRNGISFQWTARSVDRAGVAHPLRIDGTAPGLPVPPPGHAVKTEGTNMAVRRSALVALGGFDPAFRFYLDETDLNLRLAAAGWRTALVPLAQVHHGYAASARRAADRTPRDLSEIGASVAVFLRKHLPAQDRPDAWRRFRDDQRARLLRFMQRGPLGADDVARLLRGLDAGAAEGRDRPFGAPMPGDAVAGGAFHAYPARPGMPRHYLAGMGGRAGPLRAAAAELRARGHVVSVLTLGRSARYHRVVFGADGVWHQWGGLFGRSDRAQPLMRPWSLADRLEAESARVAPVRGDAIRQLVKN